MGSNGHLFMYRSFLKRCSSSKPLYLSIDVLIRCVGGTVVGFLCRVNSVSLTSVEGLQKQVGFDGCYYSCCCCCKR